MVFMRLIYSLEFGSSGWDYLVLYGFGMWGGGSVRAVNVVTAKRLAERLVVEMFSFYRYQLGSGSPVG